jgi:hypothetical protein
MCQAQAMQHADAMTASATREGRRSLCAPRTSRTVMLRVLQMAAKVKVAQPSRLPPAPSELAVLLGLLVLLGSCLHSQWQDTRESSLLGCLDLVTIADLGNKTAPAAAATCDFVVLSAAETAMLSPKQLSKRLLASSAPVLLRGLALSSNWSVWPLRESLLHRHARANVAVGRGARIGMRGPEHGLQAGAGVTQLGSVAARMSGGDGAAASDEYVFFDISNEDELVDEFDELMQICSSIVTSDRPDLEETGGEATITPRIAIGGIGSGLGFHSHGITLNVLLAGSKQWFVFESQPHRWARSTMPDPRRETIMSDWVATVFNGDVAFREQWGRRGGQSCTQTPGDVVFIPGGLIHGTLNHEKSLAVAVEMLTT